MLGQPGVDSGDRKEWLRHLLTSLRAYLRIDGGPLPADPAFCMVAAGPECNEAATDQAFAYTSMQRLIEEPIGSSDADCQWLPDGGTNS